MIIRRLSYCSRVCVFHFFVQLSEDPTRKCNVTQCVSLFKIQTASPRNENLGTSCGEIAFISFGKHKVSKRTEKSVSDKRHIFKDISVISEIRINRYMMARTLKVPKLFLFFLFNFLYFYFWPRNFSPGDHFVISGKSTAVEFDFSKTLVNPICPFESSNVRCHLF